MCWGQGREGGKSLIKHLNGIYLSEENIFLAGFSLSVGKSIFRFYLLAFVLEVVEAAIYYDDDLNSLSHRRH